MKYSASLDKLSLIITFFCCVLIGSLTFLSIYSVAKTPMGTFSFFMHLLITFVLIAIPISCYVFSIKYYRLDNNTLYICRVVNKLVIQTKDINEVRSLTNADTKGMIRTFGVGGLFGYFGRFYTTTLGSIYLYTTQRRNRILITTKTGLKIIISPDDPRLLDMLKRAMALTNGQGFNPFSIF